MCGGDETMEKYCFPDIVMEKQRFETYDRNLLHIRNIIVQLWD